ncbi:MAG: hypothetical protein LBB48_05730 [Treponema sp.]|jgi:hypothetical protein|nr:hypothetical protein [Treponema sp.]
MSKGMRRTVCAGLFALLCAAGGGAVWAQAGDPFTGCRWQGRVNYKDAGGLWSFDGSFFRLECDFFDPVFEHLPSVNWESVYQFDALMRRFTLLVKPYPGAPNVVKAAFNRVDD